MVKSNRNRFTCYAAAILLLSTACSVKYNDDRKNAAEEVPEVVFFDTEIKRVEGGADKVLLNAAIIEQYTGGVKNYGENVKFITIDDGKVSARGECRLLCADTQREEYLLFDDISLINKERGVDITADSIKWDGGSEQLTTGREDDISIKKGNTLIHGKAFSASGISGAFTFTGAVSGEIDTDDTEGEM